jgi:undecaprenyl-diphosphatase
MRNLKIYFGVVGLYWLFLASMLLMYGYRQSFLVLNALNNPFMDYIMYFLTWFGDSLFIASVVVLVFPKNTALQLMMILSVTITGLIVQALKQWIFGDYDRPLKVFEESDIVHIIGDYRLYHRSFPSGHSVTTGTAFTLLAWFLRDKRKGVLLSALMAVLVSYTRIYTGSHFPGDVLAGSMIGTLLCLLILYCLRRPLTNWISTWPARAARVFRIGIQVAAVAGIVVTVIEYLRYIY